MAMEVLSVPFEHYRTCEWEINAVASYKAIHCGNDNTDYSKDLTEEQITDILTDLGISSDGKNPLTREQISRYSAESKRTIYNNIRATHNLVNISQVKGYDLGIDNVELFTYLLTYSLIPMPRFEPCRQAQGHEERQRNKVGAVVGSGKNTKGTERIRQQLTADTVA